METYSRFFRSFEESFFATTTISILAHSCLGGAAAMAVLMNGTGMIQMVQLFLVVAVCMLFNGSVLSQQKPKVVFNLLIVGTIVNTLLATYNFVY
ncbi:MAG: hypothetical protein ITG00_11360 [Flavobacterium sp.]|nr:hypothetical protein [Flavobacterium sp.]